MRFQGLKKGLEAFLTLRNTFLGKYGRGGAPGLSTYLRIGSNLEILSGRKIGGRPQYYRMLD